MTEFGKAQKALYPRVARSVDYCRSASLALAVAACFPAGISVFASYYLPAHRGLPGYVAVVLAMLSIGCNIYISKLSELDFALEKRRDEPLPWKWWIVPTIGLLLSFAVLFVFMVFTLG